MSRHIISIALLSCCLATPAAAAENAPGKSAAEMITPKADRAIERGLGFLAKSQHRDGSFGTEPTYRGNVAICGLSGMAFLAGGSTPGRGPYGENVNRCVDYLLAQAESSGYIIAPGAPSHGPMYGHGFATLFLAECYGMSPRPELREKLAKAVKLICNTQNKEGGWRYFPRRYDADVSVTACQVMALRAARNAGLDVPKDVIDRAVVYIKRCQNADGGFMYMVQGGESAFPRSAAALVALNCADVYEGPEINKGLDYLMQFLPQADVVRRENYFEYGQYYAALAMWQAGGNYWSKWYPAARDELLARQGADGSWPSAYGSDYATAMSLIVLQVPNNYLPIFQR